MHLMLIIIGIWGKLVPGTGSNGKSVLMNAISALFGGYAKKINASTLTKASRGANKTSELYNCKVFIQKRLIQMIS
jgi:phage/plasmid-associated DNA primase